MAWDDYKQAQVRIRFPEGDLVVRPDAGVGSPNGIFPDTNGRTIHIVTAQNPGGRVAPPEFNGEAHSRLLEELEDMGLEIWPAAGGDREWVHTETSVAVRGLTDDEARKLGARYGQEAVFAWQPGAWAVLDCAGARAYMTGWVTEKLPSSSGCDAGGHIQESTQLPSHEDEAASVTAAPLDGVLRDEGTPPLLPHVVESDRLPEPIDYDEAEGSVLADLYWDLGPGGGGSPGNDDTGRVALVRNGSRYSVINLSGGEMSSDELEATSDGMALARFREGCASDSDEVITVYRANLR